jgi:hypothetical protein
MNRHRHRDLGIRRSAPARDTAACARRVSTIEAHLKLRKGRHMHQETNFKVHADGEIFTGQLFG